MFYGALMVIDYLSKIRAELLEEKLSIESKKKSIHIEINENTKFIERLKEEENRNFDAFSPRKQNLDLRNNISLLEKKQDELRETYEDTKNELLNINSKLAELDSVLKIAKKQKAAQNQYAEHCIDEKDVLKLKILETQENERQRIARELHDSSVQNLTSLVHKTELCSKLIDMDPIRCKLELSGMSKKIRKIIEDMRKMIYNLHPMSFDDIGFDVTIERILADAQKKGINTSYLVEGTVIPLKSVVALTILRVITEACNNSMKYAQADQLSVKITYATDSVQIIIQDDGIGFDVDSQENEIREDYSGFGLSTMKERICLLSGKIDIISKLGEGTEIIVKVPIDNKEV